jgi:hypothetical protein
VFRDRSVAGAGVVGTIRGDDAEGLIRRDLIHGVGQDGRIANPAAGDLDARISRVSAPIPR